VGARESYVFSEPTLIKIRHPHIVADKDRPVNTVTTLRGKKQTNVINLLQEMRKLLCGLLPTVGEMVPDLGTANTVWEVLKVFGMLFVRLRVAFVIITHGY
jgi:hypothetical protein